MTTAGLDIHDREIERKATIFRVILSKVSFMHDGMFLLKLTISCTTLLNKSGVRLRTKNSDKFLSDFSVRTEVIGPTNKGTFYNFTDAEYNFYLPKGFCKNDIEHDIFLLIEALQIGDDARSKKVGEVKLPIYPRADVVANYKREIGEPFYQAKDKIRIYKVDKTSQSFHCGELFYQSEFSEIHEIIESESVPPPTPPPPIKAKKKPPPVEISKPTSKYVEVSSEYPKSWDNDSINSKRASRLVEIAGGWDILPEDEIEENLIKVSDLPLPRKESIREPVYKTLAPEGYEEISVIVHGIENLPKIYGSKIPRKYYVSCLQKTSMPLSASQYDSTHSIEQKDNQPIEIEEILNYKYVPRHLQTFLSLLVIDAVKQNIVTEYQIPIRTMTYFLQHHLKLSQNLDINQNPINLFVSVIRKLDHYPISNISSNCHAFIVKPLKFTSDAIDNHDRYICFAYITNKYQYDELQLQSNVFENLEDLTMPIESNYNYTRVHPSHNSSHCQVTLANSSRSNYRQWNFPLAFVQSQELETIFTSNSAVVIQLIPLTDNKLDWLQPDWNATKLTCSIKLTRNLYKQLSHQSKRIIIQCPIKLPRRNSLDKDFVEYPKSVSVLLSLVSDNKLSDEICAEKQSHHLNSSQPRKLSDPFLYAIQTTNNRIENNIKSTLISNYGYIENDPFETTKDKTQFHSNRKTNQHKEHERPDGNRHIFNQLGRMQLELVNLRKEAQLYESQSAHQSLKLPKLNYYSKLNRISELEDEEDSLHRMLNSLNNKNQVREKVSGRNIDSYLNHLESSLKKKQRTIKHLENKLKALSDEDNIKNKSNVSKYDEQPKEEAGEREQLQFLLEKSLQRIHKLELELKDTAKFKGT